MQPPLKRFFTDSTIEAQIGNGEKKIAAFFCDKTHELGTPGWDSRAGSTLYNRLDTYGLKNPDGNTILHIATQAGAADTVEFLLQQGASPYMAKRY